MAVNLATKYSSKIDEVMKSGALSNAGVNNDYDIIGAMSVKIYSMSAAAMNDYSRTRANRYGTPTELQDTTQELTMSQAKSFTFTIDKLNSLDTTEGVRDAGLALRRQIDQSIIPMIDSYRFTKIGTGCGIGRTDYTTITASNAYTRFLTLNTSVSEAEAPIEGRIAFCTPKFVELLKLDSNFVKSGDVSQKDIAYKGQVGMADGVSIIQVPSTRMPAGASFIITHPQACVAPVKLEEYKIHTDAPGISGALVEGLVYHDAFLLDHKKDCVRMQYGQLSGLTLTGTAGTATKTNIVITASNNNGINKYYYKCDSSAVTIPTLGADTTGFTELPADGIIVPGSGKTHCVVIGTDINDKVISASSDTTIAIGT